MKNKLKRLTKILTLTLFLSQFWTCEKEDTNQQVDEQNINNNYSLEKLSLNEFLNTNTYSKVKKSLISKKNNSQQYGKANTSDNNRFQFISNEVLSTQTAEQTTYTTPLKKVNSNDESIEHSLLIKENQFGTSSYIVAYSSTDNSITINPILTTVNGNDPPPSPNINCVDYSVYSTTPCGCGHYDVGVCNGCSNGQAYPTSTYIGGYTVCWGGPDPVDFDPPTCYGCSGSTGADDSGYNTGFGLGAPGESNTPQDPIIMFEGVEECFSDGTCTPPLFMPISEWETFTSSEIEDEIAFENFISTLPIEQQDFLNSFENVVIKNKIKNFLENNNYSNEAGIYVKGQIELEKLFSDNKIKLEPKNGKINNRDDQKYTHFGTDGVYEFYTMEDGSTVLNSPTQLTLNSNGSLVSEFTSETSNEHYWYIKPEGSNEWSNYLLKDNFTNLAHELEITAKLTLTATGKAIGTYILPAEDIKILITGTDFDGEQVSRYQAAGFLLLTVIPGSKTLKVVGKASDALTVVV